MNEPTASEALLLDLARAAGGSLPPFVTIPPGDDMALLALPSNRLLIAADQLIEGIHFTSATPLTLIARKAIARNVSDVAAMAGLPLATIACAQLPSLMSQRDAAELFHALAEQASRFSCPLVGGDTAINRQQGARISLAITILATTRTDGVVLTRSGAREGDQVIVSGPLGGSFESDGLGRHLSFSPRLNEIHALVDSLGHQVHAAMDISDGLGVDLARLLRASTRDGIALTARLDGDAIPVNAGATLDHALADGEDYEILATVDAAARIPKPWQRIGSLEKAPVGMEPRVLVKRGDAWTDATECGYRHG